jgi:hypothetical protein
MNVDEIKPQFSSTGELSLKTNQEPVSGPKCVQLLYIVATTIHLSFVERHLGNILFVNIILVCSIKCHHQNLFSSNDILLE